MSCWKGPPPLSSSCPKPAATDITPRSLARKGTSDEDPRISGERTAGRRRRGGSQGHRRLDGGRGREGLRPDAAARSSSRPRSTPAAAARAASRTAARTSAASSSSRTRDDVGQVAEVMFKYPLVTKQTGAEGQKVSKVLVQEAADIAREIYLGMVLDRGHRHAGADGLRRGRRRHRGSRRPQSREDPQGAGRSRRRPAAVPGPPAGLRAGLHRRAGRRRPRRS